MSRRLITSSRMFNNFQIISEGTEKGGRFLVRGIMQRADSENQNDRIYPMDILKREAERYSKIFIAQKRAYGELDHPDSSIVEAKNASHTVEKLWWEGKDLLGELEVLDTPAGNIVKSILKAGKTLGISSRGLGSVNQINENTVEVGDDFEIIAWDFVTNPSTQGAFMRQINENKNRLENEVTLYKEINSKINLILRGL